MKKLMNDKSYAFSLRVIKVCKILDEKQEIALSDKLFRSGTAIGAMLRDAEFSQGKADFIQKQAVALKEANETMYWLDLLVDSDCIDRELFESMEVDCRELIALLVSSIKKLKGGTMK